MCSQKDYIRRQVRVGYRIILSLRYLDEKRYFADDNCGLTDGYF